MGSCNDMPDIHSAIPGQCTAQHGRHDLHAASAPSRMYLLPVMAAVRQVGGAAAQAGQQ